MVALPISLPALAGESSMRLFSSFLLFLLCASAVFAYAGLPPIADDPGAPSFAVPVPPPPTVDEGASGGGGAGIVPSANASANASANVSDGSLVVVPVGDSSDAPAAAPALPEDASSDIPASSPAPVSKRSLLPGIGGLVLVVVLVAVLLVLRRRRKRLPDRLKGF